MVRKKYILDKSQSLPFFGFFFSNLIEKMSSIETYTDFRVAFLHDEDGGKLWEEGLFLNLYDFLVLRRDEFFY